MGVISCAMSLASLHEAFGEDLPGLQARGPHTPDLSLIDPGIRSAATLRRYRQLWRQWLSPTLGSMPPDEITRRSLHDSLAAMVTAGQSPSSIHQAAVLLSGCFAWARHHGILGANPVLSLRLPGGTRLAAPRQR
jgi:hypothetical protein